jgi:hypothetical protein
VITPKKLPNAKKLSNNRENVRFALEGGTPSELRHAFVSIIGPPTYALTEFGCRTLLLHREKQRPDTCSYPASDLGWS